MRFALRSLLKSPGYTVIALVTLALGIGVNTSMYTLVDVLLFRTVPFDHPEQLLSVFTATPQNPRDGFAFAETDELRAQAAGPGKAFESLTTLAFWSNTFVLPGHPAEQLQTIDATADFFTTFRIQPMLGRAFTAEEEVPGKNQVVILSYRTWQKHFGGDPNVVGRTVRLNAEQVTVIGVMPATFTAPLFFGPAELWRPITIPRHIVTDRSNFFFQVVGRMNPGITPEQASAQLAPLAARWSKEYPQTSKDRTISLLPPHVATMDSTSRFIVWLLFGLGASVLLIGCANIANLQLARATANTRELAIRSALGASRGRLIWQQLTESLLLAGAGGVAGVVVAWWLNGLLGNAIRIGPTDTLALPMNGAVLGCALAASALTGLLFGLVPALFASRADVVSTLKQQTRGSTAGRGPRLMRQALIVGEVAVALALLGVAAVMIRGMGSMLQRDKGWDTSRILTANIHLPEQSTYASEDKRRLAIDELSRRLAGIAGAEHTTISSTVPIFGYSKVNAFEVVGQTPSDPTKQPLAGYTMVASDFFATLGIPFLEGHDFAREMKGDSPPVVIINETMARHFWPHESAIGKRIGDRQGDKQVWREVIGVVRDIQFALSIANPPTMFQVYKPAAHEPWGYLFLTVRGPAPATYKSQVQRVVSDFDPDVAVQEMYTIPEAADRFNHNLVVINDTLAGFALVGLVLAAVGLYGVICYVVAQRTSEFGIRLALGATRTNVLQLVLGHGTVLTTIGLVLGLGGAYGLARLVANTMPKLASPDLSTLLSVAGALFAVAMIACVFPAWRATRVDPTDALRAE